MNTNQIHRKAAWIALEGGLRSLLDKDEAEGRREVENLMDVCGRAGIDLIFPCSRGGDSRVIYESRIERNVYRWDALGFFCEKAHERGIEIHPWIILWYDHTHLHPELHVRTRDGFPEKEHWLCPAQPESRRYFLDLCMEVLKEYPIDGIHLDYIRYQDKPCYCDYHRTEFKKEFGADPLDLGEGMDLWEEWNEYNVQTISSFVGELSRDTRQIGKKVSAAVFMPIDYHRDENRNPFRLDRIGVWDGHEKGCKDYAIFQRWSDWCKAGYLDQVCPMNYTPDEDLHHAMVERELGLAAGVPLFSGLSLFPENSLEGTIEQIRQAFSMGAGVCFFDLIRLSQKSEAELNEICAVLGEGKSS
ncbi:MAG: family 10 glycosylhydrolase [Candidatus Latescibacterota bacterium]